MSLWRILEHRQIIVIEGKCRRFWLLLNVQRLTNRGKCSKWGSTVFRHLWQEWIIFITQLHLGCDFPLCMHTAFYLFAKLSNYALYFQVRAFIILIQCYACHYALRPFCNVFVDLRRPLKAFQKGPSTLKDLTLQFATLKHLAKKASASYVLLGGKIQQNLDVRKLFVSNF